MVKPTLALFSVVGPCGMAHGYFIMNAFVMMVSWWPLNHVTSARCRIGFHKDDLARSGSGPYAHNIIVATLL